jgi:hypothetical protein
MKHDETMGNEPGMANETLEASLSKGGEKIETCQHI